MDLGASEEANGLAREALRGLFLLCDDLLHRVWHDGSANLVEIDTERLLGFSVASKYGIIL